MRKLILSGDPSSKWKKPRWKVGYMEGMKKVLQKMKGGVCEIAVFEASQLQKL